jgi:glucose-6-phosphate dehydrogenase assembly protein OpcA
MCAIVRGIEIVRLCETCIIPVLISVARRRLVETGNPSACVTVNCRSV